MAGNSQAAAKPKKRRGPGKPFQKNDPITGAKDKRINRAGTPRLGESWAEIYDRIGKMTPAEAADYVVAIAGRLRSYGDHISIKEAVVIRHYTAVLNDPSPGLISVMQDRMEGRPKETIQHQGLLNVENLTEVMSKVYGKNDSDNTSGQ